MSRAATIDTLDALATALERAVPVASADVLAEPAPRHISVVLRPGYTWRGRVLTGAVNRSEYGVVDVSRQGIRGQLVVRIE